MQLALQKSQANCVSLARQLHRELRQLHREGRVLRRFSVIASRRSELTELCVPLDKLPVHECMSAMYMQRT